MKLWVRNVSPDVTGDELNSLLRRYGAPRFDTMTAVANDDSRRGVVLTFDNVNALVLYQLARRLDGLFWKEHGLRVHVLQH